VQRFLADSHIILRLDREPVLVPLEWRMALGDRNNEVFVSPATAWELGIKRAKGRLTFVGEMSEMVERLGFRQLPITMRHGAVAAELDWAHGDPFDRMLVAQAQVEGLKLVTADQAMREFFGDCL
jgi:PIN domain nuclease of toxin-antitoxin system